jgi:outer membrane protein assembly factor BamB
MQRRSHILIVGLALLLAACEIPSWAGGPKAPIKRAPGERLDVISAQPKLKPDEAAAQTPIEVPDQVGNEQWLTRNDAMLTRHIGLKGITSESSASIGDGNAFSRHSAPVPVIAAGLVYAMDAAGVISAHDMNDIDEVRWRNSSAEVEDVDDVLGGGMVVREGVLYASTGYGTLMAIDATTGKTRWKTSVGAPVRGAPAADDKIVVVLSADNQTLAFDAQKGTPRWEHRGIRESAGYFAATSPVISDGIVVAAYTSGELFAIRAETGSVLWSDTLTSPVRTRAAAVFSGIDADPIVQDGVVVVVSAGGIIQASALLNGRPLWQRKIGGHQTPWSAGNALYIITDTHDVAALLKRDGSVRWAKSLAQDDGRKDTTPPLYGPILAGNAIMVLSGDGVLHTFKPETGKALGEYELDSDVVTTPIIAHGAMYFVTKDAVLHKYE